MQLCHMCIFKACHVGVHCKVYTYVNMLGYILLFTYTLYCFVYIFFFHILYFLFTQMADFLQDEDGSDMHNLNSVIENFQKKNSVGSMGPSATTAMTTGTTAGNHMVSCTINGIYRLYA